jgi:hypothetical protein
VAEINRAEEARSFEWVGDGYLQKGVRVTHCQKCKGTMGAHVDSDTCFKCSKAEPPGPAAAPMKQGKPLAAVAPIKQPKVNNAKKKPDTKLDTVGRAAKIPSVKPPASGGAQPDKQPDTAPQIKLTRSQAQRPCPVCGLPQFRGERLVGCGCYLELAKSASATRTQDGYTVTFGHEWEPENIEVFLEGLQGLARQE